MDATTLETRSDSWRETPAVLSGLNAVVMTNSPLIFKERARHRTTLDCLPLSRLSPAP